MFSNIFNRMCEKVPCWVIGATSGSLNAMSCATNYKAWAHKCRPSRNL